MTTYTGQSIKRFEDHRLLTGQSSYVDDMTRPGMLHALIIRSPHGHARIRSIDASAALALPGVAAVITAQDIADIAVLPTRESADADELNPPRHPALAVDKACYAGQPVAIVLAENIYTAEDAVELVAIDYEILPAVIDPREATSDEAPVIHEQFGSNVVLRTVNAGGDLDGAFAEADCVITQRFDVQRVAPAPMEPRGLLAEYDAEAADLLTVWDSTQHPHEIREHLARLLDRPLESVRVACPDVGGGFGEKGCFFPEELAIPYLAMKLGPPHQVGGEPTGKYALLPRARPQHRYGSGGQERRNAAGYPRERYRRPGRLLFHVHAHGAYTHQPPADRPLPHSRHVGGGGGGCHQQVGDRRLSRRWRPRGGLLHGAGS